MPAPADQAQLPVAPYYDDYNVCNLVLGTLAALRISCKKYKMVSAAIPTAAPPTPITAAAIPTTTLPTESTLPAAVPILPDPQILPVPVEAPAELPLENGSGAVLILLHEPIFEAR